LDIFVLFTFDQTNKTLKRIKISGDARPPGDRFAQLMGADSVTGVQAALPSETTS